MLLSSSAPVTASAGTSVEREAGVPLDLGLRLRMLRQLEELHAPKEIVDALTSTDAERIRRGRSVAAHPIGDITGDGTPEVVELDFRYSLVIGRESQDLNTVAEEEITTIVRIRDAKTGRVHWTKRFDDFVLVGQARVGREGRRGLIAVAGILSFFSGSSGDRYLTFDGLRGTSGKRLWTKSYMSVAATHDYTTSVAIDSPVSFSFVQTHKSPATEILLGLSTITDTRLSLTAATRTLVLSAADGSDAIHPSVDVGVNWIPFPDAVSDLDGDGLDDYVVINDKGVYPGEGQDPPAVGGVVQARRGLDGSGLWTEGGLEFRYFAFTIGLGDVVGNRTRDFGIFTFNQAGTSELLPPLPILPSLLYERDVPVVMLVDAGAAEWLWTKRGLWMHAPGDLDRDGDRDVVVDRMTYDESNNALEYTRLAFPGVGKMIWRHRLVWRGEPCLVNLCLGGGGGGVTSAGDVHPDSIDDRFVAMSLSQVDTYEQASFVLDGGSDRVLIRSDETLLPLWAAVDGRGTDVMNARVDRNETTFRVREGSSGDTLWALDLSGAEQLLPKDTWAYGYGFSLPGDGCADVLAEINSEDATFYAVVDGADAKILWSRWVGRKGDAPRVTRHQDLNPC